MRCPFCPEHDSRVVDSRMTDDGLTIRRRRLCAGCGRRFTTLESAAMAVIKRSGVREPFSRDKVADGVRKACQGRPVTEDQLAQLAASVEATIRADGAAEIPAHDIGVAVLEPLKQLDEVAYLRYASVYQNFSDLSDFELAIAELRTQPRTALHGKTTVS